MIFRSSAYNVIILEKMSIFEGFANRKEWGLRLIKWLQIIPNRMATLFNQVHSMLNGRKFSAFLRNSLWVKATNTATLHENNLVTPNKDLSPFQQYFGKEKRSILSLIQNFWKCASPHTRTIPIVLTKPIYVPMAFRLVLQKAIMLVPNMSTIQDKRK